VQRFSAETTFDNLPLELLNIFRADIPRAAVQEEVNIYDCDEHGLSALMASGFMA
jgi:hypothetical protein